MADSPLPAEFTNAPPAVALRFAEAALGPGARVVACERLPGGTATATHALALTHAGRGYELVLKRYVQADWLAREPDIVAREARALELVRRHGLPVPELAAVDESGATCDVPALLMARLPGRVVLAPRDVGAWLSALAAPLARLHALPESAWREARLPAYRPFGDVRRFAIPRWTRIPELWRDAVERVVYTPRPAGEPVLLHRDYHACNVLFDDGHVTGVVDWTEACIGPVGPDLAHCRRNLSATHGPEVADRFLAAYERSGGRRGHDPLWDLIGLLDASFDPPVYAGWTESGLALTAEQVCERTDAYLERVMAALR